MYSTIALSLFCKKLNNYEKSIVDIIKKIVYDHLGEYFKWWSLNPITGKFELYQEKDTQYEINKILTSQYMHIGTIGIYREEKHTWHKTCHYIRFSFVNSILQFPIRVLSDEYNKTNNGGLRDVIRLCGCQGCIRSDKKISIYKGNKGWKILSRITREPSLIMEIQDPCFPVSKLCWIWHLKNDAKYMSCFMYKTLSDYSALHSS